MKLFYMAEFKVPGDDGELEHYVAAGWNSVILPVYKVTGKRRARPTRMLYPSCLRFMPYDLVSEGDPRTITRREWGRLYEVTKR